MAKNQLSVLIKLALQDGSIDQSERDLILRIGTAHGLSKAEVEDIIQNPKKEINFEKLSDEERFEILYNLVHLMKVDGEIFDEEISYCMKLTRKLGFPLEAIMDLYSQVHANVKLTAEINKIKRKYIED